MLRLSGRTVRQNRALYAGCFAAVFAGVTVLGVAASVIAAGDAYLARHPGGLAVTVTGGGQPPHTERYLPAGQTPEGLQAVLGFAAGICGFMTVFVVASAFAFAVAARRRELGLLRLAGATPGQIRRMIRGEALIVAAAAAAAGSLAACALTPAVLALAAGTRLCPVRLTAPSPWLPLAIASGTGITVALLGARASSRRAARTTPAGALREAATEPPRLTASRVAFGVLGLAGAGTMTAFIKPGNVEAAIAMAIFTPAVFVIGLTALAPVAVPLTARPWALAIRRPAGLPGYLAARNVQAAPRRTGALAAPVLAIAAIAGTLSVMTSFFGDLTDAQDTAAARPSLIITAAGGRDLTAALRRVKGVTAVDATRSAAVVLTDRGSASATTAAAINPATFQQARRLTIRQGSLRRLHGNTVAMSQTFARDGGYHLGRPARLAFPDGSEKTLTLVAITADAPGLVPDVMLPATLPGQHRTKTAPDRWIILPAPGVRLSQLAHTIRDTVPHAAAEQTSAWLRARSAAFRRMNNQGLLIILAPAGGYAGIAIISTLLTASLRRRREFATARLLGATPRQIRHMILWESALTTLAALTLAAAITATVSLLARHAMMTGIHATTTTIPWPTLAGITAASLGLATAAALTPATRMLRDTQPSAAAE